MLHALHWLNMSRTLSTDPRKSILKFDMWNQKQKQTFDQSKTWRTAWVKDGFTTAPAGSTWECSTSGAWTTPCCWEWEDLTSMPGRGWGVAVWWGWEANGGVTWGVGANCKGQRETVVVFLPQWSRCTALTLHARGTQIKSLQPPRIILVAQKSCSS